MNCHCGTNDRAPRWTFTGPCKPEVRPDAREESASPAWLAATAMNARYTTKVYGSVPVDFLRPKFRVAHTKHDVISMLINKYTYINMYIIKKIISCIFILRWDIITLLKLKWKFAGHV